MALLPLIFGIIIYYGPINNSPSFGVIITGFLGITTTVIWEELHYRVIGVELLKDKNKFISIKSIIILILIFALSHSINFIFNPNLTEIIRIIFSISTGALFLGLYLNTKNVFMPMLSHFLLNYTSMFFTTFSTSPNYFDNITNVIFYISIIVYLIIGINLLKTYYNNVKK